MFIFVPSASEVMCKRFHGTEVVKGDHYEIRPVYRKKLSDRGMPRGFSELTCHLFLEKGEDYTKYLKLEDQDCVTGYWKSPVAPSAARGFSPRQVKIRISTAFRRM